MRLVGIGVPDAPDAWERIGFRVVDGAVSFVNGSLLLGTSGLVVDRPAGPTDVDGVAVCVGSPRAPHTHPAGGVQLDHLVLLTDSLERTSLAVTESLGLPCRRRREVGDVRQAFHRFDDPPEAGRRGCIVEIVGTSAVTGTVLMGVVIDVDDLSGLTARLGPDTVSAPKPAVQPGRSISTVRAGAGLGIRVALMTPSN